MTEIIWRPEWQLRPPEDLPFNPDGSLAFGEPVGNLTLPSDYLGFKRRAGAAALRDRGSWFLARFDDGTLLCEIAWLGSWRSVRLGTLNYNSDPDPADRCLPPIFVSIGYAEPGPMDVVMNVEQGDPDFGKVYVWFPSHDPWMTGTNTRELGFVANSFADFMNNLARREAL
ncbi:MAG: hypothetical protein RLZZ437_1774 [Pseudomonadota bacterium]